jgi:signal transduction histidine kinase
MELAGVERVHSRAGTAGRVLYSVVAPRTWLAVAYLLIGLFLSVAALVAVVAGVALGVGLFPVGLVVLALTLAATGALCRLERVRTAAMLGTVVPAPNVEPLTNGRWWRLRPRAVLDWQRWRQVGAVLLLCPLQVAGFAIVVYCWSVAVELIARPGYSGAAPIVPGPGVVHGAAETAGCVVAGVVLLLIVPWITRATAKGLAVVTRALLGPGRNRLLTARIGELEYSRAAVVDAAEAERRRIERDLHDGAQQRLVAMTMELARAKAHFAKGDPQAAQALVDQAHAEAQTALTELRNLVRGVHPPVLSDRGLDAALSGLAALCPVPVTLTVDLSARPSATTESVAYFVVAEVLTNVAKHSHATTVQVSVHQLDHLLSVTVHDDGMGGADPAGAGLTGLASRVAAVDGKLSVDSPPGGPTIITAELPCAS